MPEGDNVTMMLPGGAPNPENTAERSVVRRRTDSSLLAVATFGYMLIQGACHREARHYASLSFHGA